MNDGLKEWKLVQGMMGLVAASALGFYVLSGNFQAREWFPFLPPSPPPNTLLYHTDSMRQAFLQQRFSEALGEAEWVLLRDKENPEAIRTRAACLLRVGRFAEAENVFRSLVSKDKKDIPARLSLATALRGRGEDDKARAILLRLLKDPEADALQLDAARASLNAMDFKEPLFADQPTPSPKSPPGTLPHPTASPTPEPLPAIVINLPGLPKRELPGVRPASAPLGVKEHRSSTPTPSPTPEPPVDAVTLPTPPPKEALSPLEIPPPSATDPPPVPLNILPATVSIPRRILPATVPVPRPKLAPQKPVLAKKKPVPAKKTKVVKGPPARR